MGNSLHNKIYLGRTSVLASRRLRTALTVGTLVMLGVTWMAMRGFK
ncbi:MAG: hypothetical protein JWP34_1217 [Massilia sp.]|jgi:hypothetical protein|nr:hypothetical protein [Massilia sp.]